MKRRVDEWNSPGAASPAAAAASSSTSAAGGGAYSWGGPHRKWVRRSTVPPQSAGQLPASRLSRRQAGNIVSSAGAESAATPAVAPAAAPTATVAGAPSAAGGSRDPHVAEWQVWVACSADADALVFNAPDDEAKRLCVEKLARHERITLIAETLPTPATASDAPADAAAAGVDAELRGAAVDHAAAVEALAQTQRQRQTSSLQSNTRRAPDAEAAQAVAARHMEALDMMLRPEVVAAPLTVEVICAAHHTLLGSSGGAGELRVGERTTRCGATRFMPASEVPDAITDYVAAINKLAGRPEVDHLGLASAVHIGLVSVHPFADGNGRLARILCNWALARRGVPFVVSLCSTAEQREAYIRAVRESRVASSAVPFATLLAGFLSRAWQELDRLLARRHSTRHEAAAEAVIRAARERQRADACMICLEETPNIQTLCCGAACHLNCLAQWLAEAGEPTCCHCRQPLPRPPRRPAPPAPGPPVQDGEPFAAPPDDDETTTTTTTTNVFELEDTTTTTASDAASEADTTTTGADTTTGGPPSPAVAGPDDTTTTSGPRSPSVVGDDDTTTTSGPLSPEAAGVDDTTTDTTTAESPEQRSASQTDDEGTTTTSTHVAGSGVVSPVPSPHRSPLRRPREVCRTCNSQPARNCSNSMCGRCCSLHGRFSCARHGF